MNNNYAIILAAGKGTRMKEKVNKMFLPLRGKPIIAHTLEAFYSLDIIEGIVLVVSAGEEDMMKERVLSLYPSKKPVMIVEGGEERQYSVYNGLKSLPSSTKLVAIHDGARPLITPRVIGKSFEVAEKFGAAVAGMPVKDTIKRVDTGGKVLETPDRSYLWLVQTPQTFSYSLIMEAHNKAMEDKFLATDDSTLVERLGRDVYMIEGGYDNIKVTTPEDIAIAEEILTTREMNKL
ncbi:MAG: 2-C-methyl-D-erythritol 4-phosphate cytidylyltransferase [Caldicoprobacterales bacterium]